jgi:replicative DNA helicase
MSRLPQNLDAERAVIGGILLSPDAIDLVSGKLSESDFFVPAHRLIWRAACELIARGQPCDAVTLGEWFDTTGESEAVGGGAYVIELASTTPSAANIASYAAIVRSKAILRRVVEVGQRLQREAMAADDGLAVADSGVRDLMELSGSQRDHDHTLAEAIKEAHREVVAAYESRGALRGITCGIERLDQRLGGFHRGDLIIFGARPSIGKTAKMMNMADAATKAGHRVGIISGEQPAVQLAQRLIAMNGPLPAEILRNGQFEEDHWSRYTQAVSNLRNERSAWVYDRSAPTLDELCRVARGWKRRHRIEALYVDYIQRIRVPGRDRHEEVGECARTLKDLARDLDIPVISLAQVKASVDQRSDKRPDIGDLANSDELTREADIIVMLYRDEVYNPDTEDKGIAELNVEKNRHGPTGMIKCAWLGESMRFCNLEAA